MDRKRVMEEAIHSGEMEGAYVSTEFRHDAEQYVEGDFDIEEPMTRTKRRWAEHAPEPGVAELGLEPGFTVFEYNGRRIRFRCSYRLERIEDIIEWDKGYLVVDAKYAHSDEPIEEYIDLVPVLQNLYIDPDQFLSPIKEVRLSHA